VSREKFLCVSKLSAYGLNFLLPAPATVTYAGYIRGNEIIRVFLAQRPLLGAVMEYTAIVVIALSVRQTSKPSLVSKVWYER
jgi:hypothetical protein